MINCIIYKTSTGKIDDIYHLQNDYDFDTIALEPGQSMLIGPSADINQMVDIHSPDLPIIDDPNFVGDNETFADLKSQAKLDVDLGAGAIRSRYITSVQGQAETYMIKEAEARKYLTETNPEPLNYPMLSAEVGITGPTIGDVANIVAAKADEWHHMASLVEQVRLGTKKAIDDAETTEGLEAIMNSVPWPEFSE
jgi:hypothetical protein